MHYPLVSVIVPIYNVEMYLDKCVRSIVCQSYSNLEIWLVDDGSPDDCGHICDDFAKEDSRIHVIHKLNGGLSDARNVAIDLARGEWITFIDSDDFVSLDYVEILLSKAENTGSKCSVIQPQIYYDGDAVKENRSTSLDCVLTGIEAVSAMFYQKLFDTSAWGKLYHRSLFETGIRYPKGLLFEDNPTTFLLLSRCNRVVVSQQRLYYYLIRKDSIQGADFTPVKLDQALQVMEMMQDHPEITDKIPQAYRCKMVSLAFHFIMKMPINYQHRGVFVGYVKKYRRYVFFDSKARWKTRVACLLSYFGFFTMKKIFALINGR